MNTPNNIQWTKKAFKQLKKLASIDQTQVYEAVQVLKNMPNVQQVKSLSNHEYDYRLRIGNYRVMFDWESSIKIVSIQEVKKRDERTY